jgi:hypothetical protein
MTPEDLKHFWGNHIKIQVDDEDLDFVKTRDIAKEKAKKLSADLMLLSWYSGKTGEFYPKLDCGSWDRPVWIVFAESRGADIAVNIENRMIHKDNQQHLKPESNQYHLLLREIKNGKF